MARDTLFDFPGGHKMEEKTVTGFAYHETGARYVALYRNGVWEAGHLTADPNVVLNESACVLQYAQTCFEGLKAYRTPEDTQSASVQTSTPRACTIPVCG